jgi:hypothetical protein
MDSRHASINPNHATARSEGMCDRFEHAGKRGHHLIHAAKEYGPSLLGERLGMLSGNMNF